MDHFRNSVSPVEKCLNVHGVVLVGDSTRIPIAQKMIQEFINGKEAVPNAIEADQSSHRSHSSGVLTVSCGTKLDGGVLAIGYGTDAGTDYWKVKNPFCGNRKIWEFDFNTPNAGPRLPAI